MNKVQKGDFAYYNYKKKMVVFLTVLYFALAIGLYVIGYVTTGSNKNLLTIVAVLGMLPASKSAVSMVMYLRYHGCNTEDYEMLKGKVDSFVHAYGLVFTTYKKNFEACACIVKNGYVYACISNHPNDADELKKHISDMIRQNGLKGTAGVFTNKDEYLKRLSDLEKKDDEDRANDEALLTLMLQLSL